MPNYIQIDPGGELHRLAGGIDVDTLRTLVEESMKTGELIAVDLEIPDQSAQGTDRLFLAADRAVAVRIVESDTEL